MKVKERIRIFLWIMSHGRLLTNLERWKRRMTANLICGRCYQPEERALHAIRDCGYEGGVEVFDRSKPSVKVLLHGAKGLGALDN